MYLWAAISIGLLGSLHCAGMCGPILATINQRKKAPFNFILHHSGRLLTYAMFGAVAGAFGATFSLMGLQQIFSVSIGILMVLSVLLFPFYKSLHRIESSMGRVSLKFSSLIHKGDLPKSIIGLLMGAANGLLPCGLVYLALAGAANTFTPWDGAIFMAVFGFGTLPVLLLITQLSSKLTPDLRTKFRKLIPITILIMGVLLILRGSNLGVPYLSPQQVQNSTEVANCQ